MKRSVAIWSSSTAESVSNTNGPKGRMVAVAVAVAAMTVVFFVVHGEVGVLPTPLLSRGRCESEVGELGGVRGLFTY